MSLSYIGKGTATYGTTTATVTTPTRTAGDLLVAVVGGKPDTAVLGTTPTGWTLAGTTTGGQGAVGFDTGPTFIAVYYRVATNNVSDNFSVAVTSGNSVATNMYVFRASVSVGGYTVAYIGAGDSTTGSPFTATMATDPGLTVGDMLFAGGIIPTDIGGGTQFSAEQVSASGLTTVSLTEIEEYSTTTGNDMGGWVGYGPVVTGTSTGVPTVSATAGGTTTNVAGAIGLLRIREGINAFETPAISVVDTAWYGSDASGNKTQKFEGTSSSTITVTNSGNNGSPPLRSVTGSPTYASATPSPAGGTYAVPAASTDVLSLAPPAASDKISSSFWIQVASGGGTGKAFVIYDNTSTMLLTGTISGTGSVVLSTTDSTGSPATNSGAILSASTWYRVAIQMQMGTSGSVAVQIYDSTDTQIYSSGTLSGNFGTTGGTVGWQEFSYTSAIKTPKIDQWILRSDLTATGSSTVSISASDTCAISISDVSAKAVSTAISGAEAPAVSVTDVSSVTVQISATDACAISTVDGRQINFPPSNNLLINSNSGFDSGVLSPWTNSNPSATVTIAQGSYTEQNPEGPYFCKIENLTGASVTTTITSAQVPVNSFNGTSQLVTSANLKSSVAKSVTMGKHYYDASGSLLNSSSGSMSATTSWLRFSTQTTLGSFTHFLETYFTVTLLPGEYVYIDAVYSGNNPSVVFRTDPLNQNDYVSIAVSDVSTTAITNIVSTTDACAISIADVGSVVNLVTPVSTFDGTFISCAETSSIAGSASTTDTCAISISDVAAVFKQMSASDTSAVSVSESVSVATSFSTTDTSAIGVSDSSAVLVNNTLSTTDACAITITESRAVAASSTRTDACAISVSDTSASSSTLSTTDTCAVSISEARTFAISGGANDACAVSISETTGIVVTLSTTDAAALSEVDTAAASGPLDRDEIVSLSVVDIASVAISAPGQETTALSIADTSNVLITMTRTDTSAVSVVDASSVGDMLSKSASDTAAVSVSDVSNVLKVIVASDAAAVSIAESRTMASTLSRSESTNISIVESTSESLTFASTDTSAISISESIATTVSLSANDTAAQSIAEGTSKYLIFASTDSSSISINETAHIIKIYAGNNFYVFIEGEWVHAIFYEYDNAQWRPYSIYIRRGISWV